ncbi:GNAT family N-acetyltransferase [Liquorilactobacillus satsumensis]|uniref:Acetyltransferase n=1 Tax=Liquorilactobacillus satsumensis DSM 16230 = JCM 12392 TaxID=1423801 RepID=A0A0R1V049_9LACO|nr:GNAT family N-acetyltransferase [Liquorilactobacillus satsumensis]KRL98985.1 acetyltransferase [Liquorilactobacillus satsumensis DSM 16230 = JCM 12392]MCC7666944.1 N-acetyltransferase [Liquorilactobacillus satsumensis]MCP9312242.1 GNAT family N-acetyltransferase [Liquorilactobacillus satsumensis]MCP9328746.1 GNAT family N-acetyltransferase [Liquorilactobacillus satsumensis]MCP9357226.1 GNAT family N-acetyltransferase [Liquorilactobacillus satsumensis]
MFSYEVSKNLRLALPRPIKDAPGLFALVDADRANLRRFLPWVDALKNAQDEENFLKHVKLNYAKEKSLNLVIWERQTIAGMISFNQFNQTNQSADIGYWLGKPSRGKGIITAAVQGICELGFLEYDLNRIIIRAAVDNQPSNAVAKRTGFRLEARLVQNEKLLDGFHDENQYVLLQAEWEKMQNRLQKKE